MTRIQLEHRDRVAQRHRLFFERPFARWNGDCFDTKPKLDCWPDDPDLLFRLGKRAAGALLDGVEHRAFPA